MKPVNEMTKEEFINYRIEKFGNEKTSIEKEWDKFEKEFKDMGFEGNELAQKVKRRLQSFYILLDKSPTEDYKAVFIRVKETDYGIRRQYKAAIEAYQHNPEQAKLQGLVNDQGLPLKINGFDKGTVIDLDNSVERTFIGIIKNPKSDDWTLGELKVNAKVNIGEIDFFKEYSFKAMTSQKSKKDYIISIATQITKPSLERELEPTEAEGILKKYFSSNLMEIKDLKAYVEANAKNYDRFSIIKADVFNLVDDDNRTKVDELTGKTVKKGNMLGVNDNEPSPNTITCISSPNINFNFNENTQDLIILGQPIIRTDKDGTEEVMVMLDGYYAKPEYRVKSVGFEEAKVENGSAETTDDEW